VPNGRSSATTANTAIDVASFDAGMGEANGWLRTDTFADRSSARAAFRDPDMIGFSMARLNCYETTLGALIEFDGILWHDGTESVV